jgi:predicted RNA-binding Zn ribbon-like protein
VEINSYGTDPVRLAVGLVNDPPADADALNRRCAEAGLVLHRAATDADLSATRRFMHAWTEIVDAKDPDERAELVNRQLARAASYPRLTNHTGAGWHIHYRDADMSACGVLEAMISVGTAFHLAARGMHRLNRCAAGGCDRVYADVSRSGRQRYCSAVCANRDAVRRHRARHVR